MENQISIPANSRDLHVIFMCIIEHWRIPAYEQKLTPDDFDLLKKLRTKMLELRDSGAETLRVTEGELRVIISAFEIGYAELVAAEDFETLVGQDEKRGKELLDYLCSFLK